MVKNTCIDLNLETFADLHVLSTPEYGKCFFLLQCVCMDVCLAKALTIRQILFIFGI
jgi:hypothetical protein